MDERLRSALIVNASLVVDNVYTEFLTPFLIADSILNFAECELIESERTHPLKAAKLLQILHTKDSSAYHGFRAALARAGYDYIAEEMDGDVSGARPRRPSDADAASLLIEGGVPARPRCYVERAVQLDRVQGALRRLDDAAGWAVLHGMGGSGKSVLAAEALRTPDLVAELFPGGVYWVSVGQLDHAKLLACMRNLCARVDADRPPPNNHEEAKDRLRYVFAHGLPKSLLVLDDVWSGHVVRAFDIQCRIMITTRDSSVTDIVSGPVYKVSISPGMSKDQCLEAFARWTNIDMQQLPPEATLIYRECSGLPLAITMLGALLRDHPNRWQFYLEKLQQRDLRRIKKMLAYEYPTLAEAIDMSISNLEPCCQRLYRDFAVFADGMKVPTEVFCSLWDMDVEDVEDVMKALADKSLVYQQPREPGSDDLLHSIHDLQLDFLKLATPDISKLHQKFVDSYKRVCRGELWNLPNDGYIHWFLLYHLFKARLYSEVAEVLLDLRFVDAKVRVTGPADLLHDYIRYGKVIDHHAPSKKRDFEQFVSVHAHLLAGAEMPDVMQLALCQPSDTEVYRQARVHAEHNPCSFYLNWCNKASVLNSCLLTTKLHKGAVRYACFTPDGSKVFSAAADNMVKLWDAQAGQELFAFVGHRDTVYCCALSSDDQRLVTCSADGTAKLWSVDKKLLGKTPEQLSDSPPVKEGKGPSPNLKDETTHPMFYESYSSSLTDPDSDEDNSLHTFTGHKGDVQGCATSHAGYRVVTCGLDCTVRLWNMDTLEQELLLSGHTGAVNGCHFSPDDARILSCSDDQTAIVWDSATGGALVTYAGHRGGDHGTGVTSAGFSCDGTLVASCADSQIQVWDSLSGKQRQTCNARSGNAVLCCRLSPDASIVAGGLSNYSVQLWSVCTGSLLSVYKGHTGWVYSLDFSPDGNRLVSASDDETVMIWNASSDEESQSPSLKRDFGVHYSPTGTVTVAAPDSRNRLLVLCGNEGEVICQTEKEQSRIRSCAVSHDGSTVAYGCEDGTLKLLRLAGCAIVRTEELVGHTATVRCCVFSSDDDMLVTCAEDHTLRVWSLDKGSCVICEGHQDVVWRCRLFHENSRVLSCSHDGSIRVWDVATGREVLCCAAHTEWVLCCDLSPDEKTMVSASVDRSVKLWSATTGKLLRSFTGHSDCVRSCAFSPCGRYIASGDDQGFVFLWDIHTGLLNVLSRHNSWVTDVHLSPGGNVIVSASDSVKFWRKDGELLQTFHVRGSFVKYVAPSADFSKFVTVDSAGILYVLERI